MTVQLDTEEFQLVIRQQALSRGCADCGGDLARGGAAKDASDDEFVCLSCNWFLQMERDGLLAAPCGSGDAHGGHHPSRRLTPQRGA